jgi:hypothetical protein
MCAEVCVCTHEHVRVCGCMCVWRVGQAGAHLRVWRHVVERVYLCVYGVPLVPRVVYTPPFTCVTVWDCVCMCLWLVQWRSPLPPAAALPPLPLAFRGTRALSTQSRGALTADSWPAGVRTRPFVCGTPPAGRARPH